MSKAARCAVVAALLLGAVASLIAFGIIGVGRGDAVFFNYDGRVLFAAGRTWLQGANPYDFEALARSVAATADMHLESVGFFYPPQSAALCVVLGLFPYSIARELWLLVNLSAIAAIVALTVSAMRERTSAPTDRWGPWVMAAIIIGNPFTAHVVWLGQTSLLGFAATLGAWRFASRGKWLVSGLCLGLASFKPQLCLLVVLWFLLERDWRTLLMGGLTSATMALYPILHDGGPIGALLAWRNGLSGGYALPANLPGFAHKVGIELSITHILSDFR